MDTLNYAGLWLLLRKHYVASGDVARTRVVLLPVYVGSIHRREGAVAGPWVDEHEHITSSGKMNGHSELRRLVAVAAKALRRQR